MNAKKAVLALFIITWVILGIATVIPHETAHHVSYLGYKAFCSFAPYSTIILFAIAGAFALLFVRIRS